VDPLGSMGTNPAAIAALRVVRSSIERHATSTIRFIRGRYVFSARLPGGHVYDWDKDVSSVRAAISIRPFGGNNSDPIFAEIDRALDDGNTATGNFRLVGDRYMQILQE
jgi:hypothetical protein